MINLAALAKRITQTQRRLDYEAHMLSLRLEKLDKAATVALRNAHLILDEQQKNVTAIEQMVQQLTAFSSEEADDSATPPAQSDDGASQPAPEELEQRNDDPPLPFNPADASPSGNPQDAGVIKSTIQKLANFQSGAAKRGNAA